MLASDEYFMNQALLLAEKGWGMTSPNPMVGAVIVRDGAVIGEGWHHQCGMPHAEREALADAARRGNDVTGAAIYVTLEPCSSYGRTPPCTEAIIESGLNRVVIGTLDPNPLHAGKGVGILQDAGIEVLCGVNEKACRRLNAPFFKWITERNPFVILKMAVTLDGRIATAGGDSKWITGPAARSRVQQLRRLADAVMAGGETVRQDRPGLIVREPENWTRQPRRLVVSRSLDAAALSELMPGDPVPEICRVDTPQEWNTLLNRLGAENVVTLLIEGGGELAASALEAGIVDFAEFHIAPKILGGRGSRPAVGGQDPVSLAEAWELDDVEVALMDNDVAVRGFCRRGRS